jgi:hypothetical protein
MLARSMLLLAAGAALSLPVASMSHRALAASPLPSLPPVTPAAPAAPVTRTAPQMPAPKAKPKPMLAPVRVAMPLAFVPVVERVRLEATATDLLLIEDVRLESDGTVSKEALELFVSFGAPGTPRAVDVHVLTAVGPSASALKIEFAPHAPKSSNVLLGALHQGGFVIQVPASIPSSASSASSASLSAEPAERSFSLRIRTLWDTGLSRARGVLVRLGAPIKEPIAVERIEFAGPGKLHAHFCSNASVAKPSLSVWIPRGNGRQEVQDPFAFSPSDAQRLYADDLCLDLSPP